MGDRAHIIISQAKVGPIGPDGLEVRDQYYRPPIVLYTHWNGTEIDQMCDHGIKAAATRLGDPSYFAALFIGALMADDSPGRISGIGTVLEDTGDGGRVNLVDSSTGTWQLIPLDQAEMRLK